jgi:hypothetical protein
MQYYFIFEDYQTTLSLAIKEKTSLLNSAEKKRAHKSTIKFTPPQITSFNKELI